jgi:hypothetical protein
VSRIYLDNIDHLTAYWVSLGLPLAQVSLSYGVDDLHGTILEEKIFHMAGATTPQQQTIAALEHAIGEAGREPVQRDSHYRHISHPVGWHKCCTGDCRACVRVILPVIPTKSRLQRSPEKLRGEARLLIPLKNSQGFFTGSFDCASLRSG